MYYAWNWWWFISWLIPMVLLAWVVFGWNLRRVYRTDDVPRRDELWPESERQGRRGLAKLNRGRGPRNYTRSDARIQEDICDQMALDDQLDATDLEVEVKRGVVELRGRVETRYDKRRAESIADYVFGVKDVDNKLEVRGLSPTRPAVDTSPASSV